jgi:hypothetical protein
MMPGNATISNLVLRSNLMRGETCQNEFATVTAFELDDILRRNPLLPASLDPTSYAGVSPAQRAQWDARLRWGDRRLAMTVARQALWLTEVATPLFEAFEEIEGRIDEEQAFEILHVCEALGGTEGPLAGRANVVAGLVAERLRGEVFGHTDATIRERLAIIAGRPFPREEP